MIGDYKNKKWGFIDKAGNKVVLPTLEYDWVTSLYESLAMVQLNGKCGFIALTVNASQPAPVQSDIDKTLDFATK